MKLFDHPDFEQAIIQAADYFRPQGLRPSIIEKDYYVTEALRAISTAHSANGVDSCTIFFKGGTNLSKGWNLIARFSEDIDIFLDHSAFQPPLGKKGIDRELKVLRSIVAEHPALTYVEGESQPSADSEGMTVLLISSDSPDPVRWQTACFSKPVRRADVNPRRWLNSVPT